jgi:hypothetical protein
VLRGGPTVAALAVAGLLPLSSSSPRTINVSSGGGDVTIE